VSDGWLVVGLVVLVAVGRAVAPSAGTASTTPVGAASSSPGGIAAHIRQCESGGNYRAQNGTTTASGAYQFVNGTWTGATGLRPPARAYPPGVQDRAFIKLWAGGRGAHNWDASRHCWGRYWAGR
jgi:hypothetical protein